MSSLFFIDGDRADPMPGKNERQGRSANIFFFHVGSLQVRSFSGIFRAGSARSKVAIGYGHDLLLSC
jgi:hypothetical protein